MANNPLDPPTETNNILIPSVAEIAVYSSAAFFILFVLNIKRVIDYYSPSRSDATDYFEHTGSRLANFLDERILPTVVTAAVWAAVGMVVYLIIWYIFSLVGNSFAEETVSRKFIFPNKEQRKLYAMATVGHLLLRLCGSILLVGWLALFFAKVIPYVSNMFFEGLKFHGTAMLGVLGAPLILALYLYAFTVLCRLIALKPRVFS